MSTNLNHEATRGDDAATDFWVDEGAGCDIQYYDGRVPSLVHINGKVSVSGDIVNPDIEGTKRNVAMNAGCQTPAITVAIC